MQADDVDTANFIWLTKTHTTYETNPLLKHLPTWAKYDSIDATMGYKWDSGSDWLDDYTYYAEVISDNDDDWWGFGMTTPSNGDADVPQPKVYRSYNKTSMTMLDFHRCASFIMSTMLSCCEDPCPLCRVISPVSASF